MSKKFHSILAALLLAASLHAQPGGLLRKAKEKISGEPAKSASKTETPPPAATQPAEIKTPVQENNGKTPVASTPVPATAKPLTYAEGSPYWVKPGLRLPLHDKYDGKIVFSAQKLTPENTKESVLKNSFNIDEPVYGRIFIPLPVKNYVTYSENGGDFRNEKGGCVLNFYINGNKDKKGILASWERVNNTNDWITWQCFINARGEDAELNSERFTTALNALPDGKHTITLELLATDYGRYALQPLATGEFTINKLPGKKMSLGRTWALLKAGMSNPALEKEMVAVMQQKAAHDGWKETFSKAKILDKDWYVTRNEYTGEKLYRTINATVYAKWPDGHCTAQEFNFKQQWTGAAWSKILEFNGVGNQTVIDCD